SGMPTFTVVKDAHGWPDIQSNVARQVKAHGIACYYHPDIVRKNAPWSSPYQLLRIHHSVDAEWIRPMLQTVSRRDALVSGSRASCYPVREAAFRHAGRLGLDMIQHPGYGNQGSDTPRYLTRLAGYKVHLATASRWGYALRKIIESVACGVTPITNLPF